MWVYSRHSVLLSYLFILAPITSKLITLMTESLLRFSLICMCVRVHTRMCTHVHAPESRCLQSSEEAVTSSGPEVTGNCGMPNVGSGYWILVFYESSMCSRAPRHLSIPMTVCKHDIVTYHLICGSLSERCPFQAPHLNLLLIWWWRLGRFGRCDFVEGHVSLTLGFESLSFTLFPVFFLCFMLAVEEVSPHLPD